MPIDENIWNITNEKLDAIRVKVENSCNRLKDWNIHVGCGLKTGYNDAFLIQRPLRDYFIKKDPNCINLLQPILRGRDTRRYYCNFAEQYLIHTYNGKMEKVANEQGEINRKRVGRILVENDYPIIYEHLQKHQTALEKREDKGVHWTNLRNCAYVEEFAKEKIIFSEITSEPQFYYDTQGYYPEATVFFITGERLKYLTALLNSKAVTFLFKSFYMGGELVGKIRYKKAFLEQVPIPMPSAEQELQITSLVDEILAAKALNSDADITIIEAAIDNLIYQFYKFTEEEIAIIEDRNAD